MTGGKTAGEGGRGQAADSLIRVLAAVLLVLATVPAGGEEEPPYRRTIRIYVENKSPQPRHVQVRDLRAGYGIPEDCRVAARVAELCGGDRKRELPPKQGRRYDMTCAVAVALSEEPRCAIADLVFDDWIDPERKAGLTLFTDGAGLGTAAVRAVDNTSSWTVKTGLRDGEIIGHQ